MSLQGSISSIGVPDLFTLLHQLRKSGFLTLVTATEERGFLLFEGNFVYATSRDESRRLGSYLVRLGYLSDAELSLSLEGSLGREDFLGHRLLASGRLSREQIRRAVKTQIMDVLDDVIRWQDGAFHFAESPPPYAVEPDELISAQSVMLDVARRADEHQQATELFPDLNLVLVIDISQTPPALEEVEMEALALLDGKRSVGDVLFESPLDVRQTAILIDDLQRAGALRRKGVKASRSEGTAAPDLRSLPVSPSVPSRVLAIYSTGDEVEEKEQATDLLSREPLLTAKLLKTLTLKNVDVHRADLGLSRIVDLLGDYDLRNMLIPEAVRGLFYPQKQWFWKDLWEHSQFSGLLARRLADETGYSYPEEAHLAGLLHNIGALILLHHDPRRYLLAVADSQRSRRDVEDVEEEVFGISHTRLGGKYAEKWRFPMPLQLVLKNHHRLTAQTSSQLLQLVAVATGIIEEKGARTGYNRSARKQLDGALERLSLDRREVEAMLWEIRRKVAVGLSDRKASLASPRARRDEALEA